MADIAELLSDKELLINALSFKTAIFEEMGEKDSVLFLDKYLYNVYIKELNDTVSAVTGMSTSIPIFIEQGDIESAEYFLQLYRNKSGRFQFDGKFHIFYNIFAVTVTPLNDKGSALDPLAFFGERSRCVATYRICSETKNISSNCATITYRIA